MRRRDFPPAPPEELIATFGDARLLKLSDRTYELRGGSPADRAAAAQWISLFMPKDIVHGLPPPPAKKPPEKDIR
jgi:hypothetical protein